MLPRRLLSVFARVSVAVVCWAVTSPALAQGVSETNPTLRVTFTPDTVLRGEPSLLTITFFSPAKPLQTLFVSGDMSVGTLALFDPSQAGQPLETDCAFDGNPVATQGPNGLSLSVPFASVSAGQQCSISLKVTAFAPDTYPAPAAGPVFDNSSFAAAAAQFFILGGVLNVVDAPIIALSPTTVDFAFALVGSRSGSQSVTVSNAGNLPLSIASLTISGDFGFSTDCVGKRLVPAQVCVVSVTFSPLQSGFIIGELAFASNDPFRPVSKVALWGRGVPVPEPVAVTPANLDFPDTVTGAQSEPLAVTLTNRSTSAVELLTVATDNPAFAVRNECPLSLPSGQACQLLVRFTPQSDGPVGGSLQFGTTPANAARPVRLAGVGIAPPARVRWIPGQAAYEEQVVATASDEVLFRLVNEGTRAAIIRRIYATGDFVVSSLGACSELPAGALCLVGVRFIPSQAGERGGALIAEVLGAGEAVSAQLVGTGQATPTSRLELSATGIGYGNAWVGSQSLGSVTLRNRGTGPLTLGSISVGAPFRIQAMGCSPVLAPREACVIAVAFEPPFRGVFRGSVIIESDTPAGAAKVDLSGSGCGVVVTSRGAALGC